MVAAVEPDASRAERRERIRQAAGWIFGTFDIEAHDAIRGKDAPIAFECHADGATIIAQRDAAGAGANHAGERENRKIIHVAISMFAAKKSEPISHDSRFQGTEGKA